MSRRTQLSAGRSELPDPVPRHAGPDREVPARHGESDDSPSAEVAARQAQHHAATAHLAYLRAELRGFVPGHELEDWLAAEAELDGPWFALPATTTGVVSSGSSS